MARIGNFPCPAHLDRKPPVIHTHPSNGVFIAVDSEKETVYCSCSECEYESDRVRKGGNLELVKGTENQRYAWAILTKEAYNTLVGTPPVTGTLREFPQRSCACVRLTCCMLTSISMVGRVTHRFTKFEDRTFLGVP